MGKAKFERPKPGFLLRINPLLKMGVAIAFTSFALALHHLQTLGLLVGLLLGLGLVSVRIRWKVLIYALISLGVFASLSVLFQGRH